LSAGTCCGESFIGNLFDPASYNYLARFCFRPTTPHGVFRDGSVNYAEPRIQYEVDFPAGAKPTLAFYFVKGASWDMPSLTFSDGPSATSSLGCVARLHLANFRIKLWEDSRTNAVSNATNNFIAGERALGAHRAKGSMNFDASDHRWFHVVVAHCDMDCEEQRVAKTASWRNRGTYCEGPVHVQYVAYHCPLLADGRPTAEAAANCHTNHKTDINCTPAPSGTTYRC
jgi:hypothetical protein